MLFSIVTVSYNAVNEIEKTIQSVEKQTCKDFEYLIIDGKSSDGTAEAANNHIDYFAKENIPFIIVSEKDNGIYDAMNKGIDLAKGDYIIFMNAGDTFFTDDVLAKLKAMMQSDDQIICGSTCVVKDDYQCIKEPIKVTRHSFEMPAYHQSIVMKTDLLKQHKFGNRYMVANDIESIFFCWKDGATFRNIPITISVFGSDGFSSQNFLQLEKDIISIYVRGGGILCPPFYKYLLRYPFMAVLFWLRKHISDDMRYRLNKVRYFFAFWKKKG